MKYIFFLFVVFSNVSFSQTNNNALKPRARDIGIPFNGTPGKYNAITDVKAVEVGYSTIISGSGKKHKRQRPSKNRGNRHFPKRKK